METRANEAKIEWNDRPIVRVEGTVLIRNDLGWTPHRGAGPSRVAIYESTVRTAYRIYGYKIQDKCVTLDTLIPPRMPFTQASLIFHHWVIGDQRMGITYHGTADARSFDRGIRVALENLEKASMTLSSSSCTSDEPNSASPTSTRSFSLPFPDETSRFEGQSSAVTSSMTQQLSLLPRVVSSTLPPPTFRQHTMSASSSRSRRVPLSAQRRHSSSVPGRPQRVPPLHPQPTSPIVPFTTELSALPVMPRPSPPSTPDSPLNNRDDEKDICKPNHQTSGSGPTPRPPTTSSRRHRSRHRHEPNSHHRSRRTKTPNLDHLERQRDLQPTKPNSYVQMATSRATTALTRNSALRTNDDLHYHTNRFLSQRTNPASMREYSYQGLKSSDDALIERNNKPFFTNCPSSFSSYSDPGIILKQPGLRKCPEYDRRSGKHKEDLSERSRCKHCQGMFNHDRNRPGSCPDAPPDSCEVCVEYATCLPVAHCVLYNCFRDSEGNYDQEPCSCSRQYNSGPRRRRWLVLGIISLFCPCLCLYPLLKSCHRCGVACHCCGGRHETIPPSRENS